MERPGQISLDCVGLAINPTKSVWRPAVRHALPQTHLELEKGAVGGFRQGLPAQLGADAAQAL